MNSNKIFDMLSRDVSCRRSTEHLPEIKGKPFHNHDGYEIYLFLNGNVDYYVEAGGKHLERGDLILTAPYAFHAAFSQGSEEYDRIVINMRKEYMTSLLRREDDDLTQCFIADCALHVLCLTETEISKFVVLTTELETALNSQPSFGDSVLAKALLSQILVFINRKVLQDAPSVQQGNIMPLPVSKAISFVNAHHATPLTVSELAKALHYHPDYLNRQFKSITGVSIQQFLIEKKCTHAKMLLAKGMPPSEVCLKTGFMNYSNFSRTFSKYVGISPKRYQSSTKNIPNR